MSPFVLAEMRLIANELGIPMPDIDVPITFPRGPNRSDAIKEYLIGYEKARARHEEQMRAERIEYAAEFCGEPRPGFVYFVSADAVNLIKIGWSGEVRNRLRSLQSMSPLPLTLLATVEGTQMDERAYHAQFAKERAHGEWFRASDRFLALIASLVAEQSAA